MTRTTMATAGTRLRIGLIHQRYVSFGGAERYLNALATGLLALGHEVHIFSNHWDPAAPARGLILHHVPMLPGASWLKLLTFGWNSARIVSRTGCDLVLSLERTWRQEVYRAAGGCHRAWLVQRSRYARPWKRVTNWLNPLHPLLLWMESRVFSPRNTQGVIALSHQCRDEILEHYSWPAERIAVVHLGVDLERFRPAENAPAREPFQILFVGSGWERKGLAFAIQALARLPVDTRLLVFGKGNTARYRRLAGRFGCAGRIDFCGVSDDMPRVYRQGHLLLHPAIYEPFGNVCLEAMASGLPLVASRIVGGSELIDPWKNGAVVDDTADIPALAEAVRFFMDPTRRAEAARAARQTAEAHPFSRNVAETLDFMTRIHDGATREPRGQRA